MAAKRGPTLRARWLGQELRKLREENNLTLKDVGDYIQRDASSVSRMESGTYPARVPDVLAYLSLCGVSKKQRREALLTLARDTWQTGWWDGYADDVGSTMIDRVWLESQTRKISSYESMVVAGLLQTPAYADSMIRTRLNSTPEQFDRWLELRLTRQKILTKHDPVQLEVILDEAAIRRPIGGRKVAADQLRHLVDKAAHPNIQIRVLPFSVGTHPGVNGPFEIFHMAEPYADIGCVDSPAGTAYLESSAVDGLVARYDRLREAALGPAESTALLEAAADDME
ncbi:MAG: helix-turn-helix domain-containing protein [Micromonosporaceae bacterium]